MKNDFLIQKFTQCYEVQDFWKNRDHKWLDCSDIAGTNGYCDEEAAREIQRRMRSYPVDMLHWIDGGNYHYISRFWTDRIETDFDLIVFDNHTDMQQSAFGDILSCGSWIRSVIERNKRLQKVLLLGVRADYAASLDGDVTERVNCITTEELQEKKGREKLQESLGRYPVYLSIDKDVLDPKVLRTDWDQGSMSYVLLETLLQQIIDGTNIIGADICGECAIDQPGAAKGILQNDEINKCLLDFFSVTCFNDK